MGDHALFPPEAANGTARQCPFFGLAVNSEIQTSSIATGNRMNEQSADAKLPQVPGQLMGFGVFLVVCGGFIAFFVAQEALGVYLQWGDNAFVAAFTEHFGGAELFVLGKDPLVLTAQGAAVTALALFILLALLGIHIAIALMRTGVHILSPTFPYQLARLKMRIDRLGESIRAK